MSNPATQFKKGEGGRKKGATNKANRLVKDVVSDVFNHLQIDPKAKKKRADLKSWSQDHPRDFYTIAAKLIPVQMQMSGDLGINWKEEKIYEKPPESVTTKGVPSWLNDNINETEQKTDESP